MSLAPSHLTTEGLLAAWELTGPYPLSCPHHGRVPLLQTQVQAVRHRKSLTMSVAAYVAAVIYLLRKEMAGGKGFWQGTVALSEAVRRDGVGEEPNSQFHFRGVGDIWIGRGGKHLHRHERHGDYLSQSNSLAPRAPFL